MASPRTSSSIRAVKRPKKKPSYRLVKIHRSYTIEEASHLIARSKLTIRRWIKTGDLPALTEMRPHLILGRDLSEFLKAHAPVRNKLLLDEWFCLKCKAPRKAALGLADYVGRTSVAGRLSALCDVCSTLMHKAIAVPRLGEFQQILEVSLQVGRVDLHELSEPCCSDNSRRKTPPDA